MASDIFRDMDSELAEELEALGGDPTAIIGVPCTPDEAAITHVTETPVPDGITHDDEGIPSFRNVPTSATLIAGINRGYNSIVQAVATKERDDEVRTINRSVAYSFAARALADVDPADSPLTSAQGQELRTLIKQLESASVRLLRS